MRITIVVDNQPGPGLASEHGFALWIEVGERRILFDTGQGASLPANVEALGVDLSLADDIVLSHGHYDHTGSLAWVLERARRATVHLHPGALRPRYALRGTARSIGMAPEALAALARLPTTRVDWVEEPALLAPGLGLTGAVPRVTPFEDPGGPFFLDRDGQTPDPIPDDLSLWLDTPEGLVLCLGCAHAGVVNIASYVQELTGGRPIHTLLGGMHLGQASPVRLRDTVAALRGLSLRRLIPCHCTGDAAVRALAGALGLVVTPGRSGQIWS